MEMITKYDCEVVWCNMLLFRWRAQQTWISIEQNNDIYNHIQATTVHPKREYHQQQQQQLLYYSKLTMFNTQITIIIIIRTFCKLNSRKKQFQNVWLRFGIRRKTNAELYCFDNYRTNAANVCFAQLPWFKRKPKQTNFICFL